MFSKLVFTIEDKKIEFHLHEIVKIALDILKDIKGEKVVIPKAGMFNSFLNSILKKGLKRKDAIDKYLLIPLHISGLNTLGKWLFVAKSLAENYQRESLSGWWVII